MRAAAVLALLLASGASAQSVGRAAPRAGPYVFTTVEMDPTLDIGLGAGTTVDLRAWERLLELEVGASVPLAYGPVAENWRVAVAARMPVLGFEGRPGWGAVGQLGLRLDRHGNAAFDALGLSGEAWLQPGWFTRDWFVALDLGYRGVLLTSLQFTDATRRLFDADVVEAPRDGVYGFAGGYFFGGVIAGARLTRTWELAARAGVKTTQRFRNPWQDLGVQAFFVGISVLVRLGVPPKAPPPAFSPPPPPISVGSTP